MEKRMDSWNGIRKYLEDEMLAECLKGRVRWNCIRFPGMEGASSFEIYVDDALAKRFSMEKVVCAACGPRVPGECNDMRRFWESYWAQKALPMNERSEFDDEDFTLALAEYCCLDVQKSIDSDDPMVRLFAILDHRIGKSTLEKLVKEVEHQPKWIQPFYRLRIEAEQKTTR